MACETLAAAEGCWSRQRIAPVGWEWIKDVGWIGTSVVALGGLGAAVWTARRSGQVQLTVQDIAANCMMLCLEDNRRKGAI